MKDGSWKIRPAEVEDLDAVVEVERLCFGDPWPREALEEELIAHPRRCPLVAEIEDQVRGVILVWVVADELQIISLAVHPQWRRHGIATALLHALDETEAGRRAQLTTLEVRECNEGAIAFYERHGFVEVARRPHYYPDTREAALVMVRPRPSGEV